MMPKSFLSSTSSREKFLVYAFCYFEHKTNKVEKKFYVRGNKNVQRDDLRIC